jgi:hypothetical protein
MLQVCLSVEESAARVPCRKCEHALMFHRGVGVVRIKQLFIVQKVDLLVNYLIGWPGKQARTGMSISGQAWRVVGYIKQEPPASPERA